MNTSTLAAINPAKVITIPGAQFSENSLSIADDATPKQLGLIGDFLNACGNSAEWWRADYVQAVAERNQLKDAACLDDPNAKARTICEEHGMEQGAFYFYLSVAAIFPPDVRVDGLSFEHHKEAVQGSDGDSTKAKDWLVRAVKEGWSVGELRRAMRQSSAEYKRDGRDPSGNGYSALIDATRWAKTQEKFLPNYTAAQAKAILGDVQPLRDFIAKVEEIAGQ